MATCMTIGIASVISVIRMSKRSSAQSESEMAREIPYSYDYPSDECNEDMLLTKIVIMDIKSIGRYL